jgi:hypothetical protein
MPKGGKKKSGNGTTAVAEKPAEEAPAETTTKKAKKEQPQRVGLSTKEAAALLGVTPVRLRRILRTADYANDGAYTRYDLDDATIERLRASIAAGADGATRKPRMGKKNAEVQEEAEDVEAATAELEADDEEEEELEDLDLEDDEDEEEDDE